MIGGGLDAQMTDRISRALNRLSEFLSRAKTLEKVTFKVLDWTQFPDCFSRLFQDLLHTTISKGCSNLQVQCPDLPFGGHGWILPAPVHSSPPTGLSLSAILFGLRRLLFSSKVQHSRVGDLHLPVHLSPGIISQVNKLDVDSTLFHPSGARWMSDFLARSPLTDFTISMSQYTAPYFATNGLASLLKGAPQLQSLTILNATSEEVQQIAPRLRPFIALKNLTLRLSRSSFDQPSSFEDSARPFSPANLERLSLSAELVNYMLLGTVTALNLKEIEITCGVGDKYTPRGVVEGIASVHDFFDKISVPISISVRFACAGACMDVSHPQYNADDGSPLLRGYFTDPISVPFLDAPAGLKFQNQEILSQVDALTLELYPQVQRYLELDDLDRVVDLVGCFAGVRKVIVRCTGDFREAPNEGVDVLKEEVAESIVQPIYARCTALASLWVGEEEFLRPLVDI